MADDKTYKVTVSLVISVEAKNAQEAEDKAQSFVNNNTSNWGTRRRDDIHVDWLRCTRAKRA